MERKRIFNKELLDECLKRDGATLVGEYDKINRDSIIKYTCKCSVEYSKMFRYLLENGGAFCDIHTLDVKAQKRKKTNLNLYGVEHALQNSECMKKAKETMIKRHGVEHPLYSSEIKDRIKETNIKRYGVENPSQNNEIKQKKKETTMMNYGVLHNSQSEFIKKQKKETTQMNYGVDNPSQSSEVYAKIRETNIKRYGVENPMQNTDILQKSQEGCKNAKKWKIYTMPSGEIRKVQGYEPFALDILVKLYTEDQIKTERKEVGRIKYEVDGKSRYYFPDIAIPHENKLIEVKSTWTITLDIDKITAKSEAAKAAGFAYEIWIFDAKGVRL
jgi:hypothetical protein